MIEGIIERWSPTNNFWKENPDFRVIESFNKFYNNDKSKDKEATSNIMWAIAFCIRRESPMYNLPNKWELAAKDIIKDASFSWDSVEFIINMFKQCSMTQAEKSLLDWEYMMFNRDKVLKNTRYYFDEYKTDKDGNNIMSRTGAFITIKGTAEQLDRAFSATPKMYSDFAKIKKEIEEDDIKRGRGNKIKSLTDSDDI